MSRATTSSILSTPQRCMGKKANDLLIQLASEFDHLSQENAELVRKNKDLTRSVHRLTQELSARSTTPLDSASAAQKSAPQQGSTQGPPLTKSKRGNQACEDHKEPPELVSYSSTLKVNRSRRGSRWLIHSDPDLCRCMLVWHNITLLALAWVAIIAPVQAAFLYPGGLIISISSMVDLVFLIDLILQFFLVQKLPSKKGGDKIVEKRHKHIACNYIKSWFILDLVTLTPFDLIARAMGRNQTRRLNAIKILRCLKLVKLIRIVKAGHIVRQLEVGFALPYQKMKLVEISFVVVLLCHWTACLWLMSLNFREYARGPSWIDTVEGGTRRKDSSSFSLYMSSLYFATYTVTTVGLFDGGPMNMTERVLCIIIVLVSSHVWAYVTGSVFAIVLSMAEETQQFQKRMNQLNWLLYKRNLPYNARYKLRAFFVASRYSSEYRVTKALLEHMSPALRGEVAMMLNQTWLLKVPFLRAFCNEAEDLAGRGDINSNSYRACIADVAVNMDTVGFCRHETFLYVQVLHILYKGMVSKGSQFLGMGSVWGEDFLLQDHSLIRARRCHVIAYSEVLIIDQRTFMKVVSDHSYACPQFRAMTRRSIVRLAARRGILNEAARRKALASGSQIWSVYYGFGQEVRAQMLRLGQGRDIDAYAAAEQNYKSVLGEEIVKQLPPGLRLCILGGTALNDPNSEALLKELATEFIRLNNRVVILTGGMKGVQFTFSHFLGDAFAALVHLLPQGQSSGFNVGMDMACGKDLPERMGMFANLGHIYLTVEGGPGVAMEAKQAWERGALVLPMMSTGGASSGMFEYPHEALERPRWVADELWSLLKTKGRPKATAIAVVQIIEGFIETWRRHQDASLHDIRHLLDRSNKKLTTVECL